MTFNSGFQPGFIIIHSPLEMTFSSEPCHKYYDQTNTMIRQRQEMHALLTMSTETEKGLLVFVLFCFVFKNEASVC